MLIYARFEFDSAIYCNFCSFGGFIYLLIVIWGSWRFFVLLLFIFGFIELFTFFGKTCFVEKVF